MSNPTNNLDGIRQRINGLDAQLMQLLEQRMQLADEVVSAKLQTGGEIYVPQREQAVLDQARAALPPQLGQAGEALMKTMMRLSREHQYNTMLQADQGWALGSAIRAAAQQDAPAVRTVAYQGAPGAYSQQAAQHLYPDAEMIAVRTFEGACRQVANDNVDIAVLPLENSTAGTVDEVYALLEKHSLYIQNAVEVGIRHAVLGLPGTVLSQVKKVLSHPQALGQCSLLITGMGWQAEQSKNTAFAAQQVAQAGDTTQVALASPQAGKSQGLVVLMPEASDTACNQTRFIAVGRGLRIAPDADRISLILKTANTTGSLNGALAVLADLGLNLAKLQSRPIPKQPWDYSFYVDVMAPPLSEGMLRALYQLEKEAQVRLLGWYPLGHAGETAL